MIQINTLHDQFEIYAKKQDISSEKRENGMAVEKWDFPPKSSNVDTYGILIWNPKDKRKVTLMKNRQTPFKNNWYNLDGNHGAKKKTRPYGPLARVS